MLRRWEASPLLLLHYPHVTRICPYDLVAGMPFEGILATPLSPFDDFQGQSQLQSRLTGHAQGAKEMTLCRTDVREQPKG